MKIINRKFNRRYEAVEKFETGIALSGAEVKSIRQGGLRLDDAYVKFLDEGPVLINAEIPAYRFAQTTGYDPKRTRKLLLSKKEILRIKTKLKGRGNLTVVPIMCYNKGDILKLEIALARGRKEAGKRKYEKQISMKRNQQREMKETQRSS